MPEPVRIRYQLMDGRSAMVDLRQVGQDGRWVLDLWFSDGEDFKKAHQHAIAGTPEVTVG